MDRCSPRRLSIYGHNGLKFSETMEVAEMVMTGRHRRVPIIRGHLGSALYRQRVVFGGETVERSEEHTSELQSLMRISYAVFCLKKKLNTHTTTRQKNNS